MARARRQVMVDAPVERVWELIGDVNRHPEWWPRVEEVDCDLLEEGRTYRQVTSRPGETVETTMSIERLDDCEALSVRCLDTGFSATFLLTPARDGTFVDAELAMDGHGIGRFVAPAFIRRWIGQSLEGLRRAAVREQPGGERSQQGAG